MTMMPINFNIMTKVAGIVALIATACKIALSLGISHEIINFVAFNSAFFYGLAAGIAVSSLSKNVTLVFVVIVAVFILLKYVGW